MTGSATGALSRPDRRLALSLSSSTGVVSAAVGLIPFVAPEGAVTSTTLETDRRHAEEISPLILKLLADAGVTLADLDLLVVDVGPGRFTGLRVGLATIKTLAFALAVPVVDVTSLGILAATPAAGGPYGRRLPEDRAVVTAVVDARRNEVFQQSFRDGEPLGPPRVGPAAELAATATGLVLGDGVDRYRETYARFLAADATLVPGVRIDGAVMLGMVGDRPGRPAAVVTPLYLRDPDVNPNVKTRPRT